MVKFRIYLLGFIFALFCVTACEKDDEKVVNEAEVLAEYLASTDSPLMKDYVNTELPSIISATELRTLNTAGEAHIIDIRAAADFETGHIPNAVNVAVPGILTHMESINTGDYTKIAVVCYSGQTAGWVTSLLRLMGYDNVFSLKWGMSSWHDDFASPWKGNVSNMYSSQFTSDATAKASQGEMPELSTGFENGQDILEARVQAVLTEGYDPAKISKTEVFNNLDDYYIVNYWPADQYSDPGHVPGAVQYTPKQDLKVDVDLKTLPTDKTIVVYCYTGQTSSFMAAYLRL
ncbi:MAG: rhodanese-like domain-containing protein, partial [Bacteroidales bacterium]